jgi:hypothetical protein
MTGMSQYILYVPDCPCLPLDASVFNKTSFGAKGLLQQPIMQSLRSGMQQSNMHSLKTWHRQITGCIACFAAKNTQNNCIDIYGFFNHNNNSSTI